MGTGLHLIGKHKGERLEYTVGYFNLMQLMWGTEQKFLPTLKMSVQQRKKQNKNKDASLKTWCNIFNTKYKCGWLF